ncbi:SusC/RagA family TonB-linked outer membrane protein [uncultured Polaribacter sp.]|uniref:SusC/RagA family TonB-linked outer membrane protein n=1 Tax=uncultured Polaribacter sp. TaxID=174711 RepID=UPI0026133CF9|nr:SusC/RagA family TonB-linked outer membrane protein [uncultured Polaribacter sp.]
MKQTFKKRNPSLRIILVFFLLFSGFTTLNLEAQERITGSVSDNSGNILPGVNILQKGTRNGASTDFDGNYSITLQKGQKTLVFSYLGYKQKEVSVGANTTINVVLEDSSESLEEIVVIGFREVKRDKILGGVSTVKAESIQQAAPVDPLQGIQGKMSGVQIVSNNGPGEGFDIRIRGVSTFTSGNTGPLYVVDGQQTFNIDNIDPNDIESLEVLKDGATTAIYGAQGANGVVIVKTKTGKSGKIQLSITNVTGVNKLIGNLPAPNAAQRIEQERRMNLGGSFIGAGRDSLSLVGRNSPDIQKLVTRPALRNQVNVALSGGSDKVKFYWNTGFFNESGIIINSGHKRVNTRLKLDLTPNEKFKTGTLINLSYEFTNSTSSGPVLGHLLNRVAYLPLFEPDGSFTPGSPRKFSLNPIQNAILRKNDRKRYRANLYTYAQYKVLPSLSIRSTVGADFFYDKREGFVPSILDPRNFADGNPTGSERHQLTTRIQQDNTLNFNHQWGDHDLGVFAGMQIQKIVSDNLKIDSRFSNDLIETFNNADPEFLLVDTAGGDATQKESTGLFSLYAGFDYDYKNKYLLGGTIRRDGSSKFGANNKYGIFPSVTAGWRISKENFLRGNSIIKNLLVKASYGIVGNDRIPNYNFTSSLVPGADYNGETGFAPSRLGNADLRWEETESTNLQLDMSMFKGRRLNLSLAFWRKVTDGLLVNTEIPEESGFNNIRENRGVVRNQGIDFEISGTILKTKDFSWRSGFNIGLLENTVQELDVPIRTGRFITEEGSPIGNIWGYKNYGVFQYDESNAFTPSGDRLFPNFDSNGFFLGTYNMANGEQYPLDGEIKQLVHGSTRNILKGGDYIWDDANGDFVINSDDEQVLGNGLPTTYGGFSHDLTYKNWTLGTLFDYSYGNEIYRRYDHDRNSLRATVLTVSPDRLDNAWQNQGDIAQYPILQAGRARNQNRFDFTSSTANSTYVSDGSFIRWRYVRLGYKFPKDVLEQIDIGITGLSFNFAVNNLLTWTNYEGYNPEFGSRGNPLTPSEDALRYPNDREFLLTLKAQF